MVTSPIKRRLATSGERGGISIFMIMTLMVLLLLAAVSTDIGHAFNAKREATNIASAAARHGANAVNPDSLYSSGVAQVDLGDAIDAAQAAVPSNARWISTTLFASREEIEVQVEVVHETLLLGMIGIDRIEVRGVGTARVQNGSG